MELRFLRTAAANFSYVGPQSNMERLTLEPKDPVEYANVYVKHSNIAGEGLFAKKSLSLGSLISLYGGILVTNVSDTMLSARSQQEMEMIHRNFLRLNVTHVIDVPGIYSKLANYKATVGHKANHSFKNNAKFGYIRSPR